MFRIRVYTPAIVDENGWPHAGAELLAGDTRKCFRIDLRNWIIAEYERLWRNGIALLARGSETSALMSAVRGRGDERPHMMWALRRDGGDVHIQPESVV